MRGSLVVCTRYAAQLFDQRLVAFGLLGEGLSDKQNNRRGRITLHTWPETA